MTDPLDSEIRRMMGQLSSRAPMPPTAQELGRRPPPQPVRPGRAGAWLLAGAVIAGALTLVLLPRISEDTPTEVATEAGPVTTRGPAAEAVAGALPEPTFVTLATPPEGLRFIEAARGHTEVAESNEVLVAGPGGRAARLLWTRGCGAFAPPTTLQPGTGSDPAAPSHAEARSPMEAAFVPNRTGGGLSWCHQNEASVILVTFGFGEAESRALAATVRSVPDRSNEFTLSPPAGFVAGRPRRGGTVYALAFRPDPRPESRPRLNVSVRAAWATDVRLLAASSVLGPTTEVDVGGRPGFIGQMPGGPVYQSLFVLYDDRTIVQLNGDGLSPEQLISAAASLVESDRSLALDAAADPARCERLGLCG